MNNVRKRIKPKPAFQCINYENKLQRMVTKIKTVGHVANLDTAFSWLVKFIMTDGHVRICSSISQ